MSEKIGRAAGVIWSYLNDHGAATANKIRKGTQRDAATVHLALGWLARENKVNIETRGRTTTYSLR